MNIHGACIGKFKVGAKISSGAYGDVYEAECQETSAKVALKIEKKSGSNQIRQECTMYKLLKSENNYICKLHHAGSVNISGAKKDVLAIDLLGPSLESLFNYCDRRFSLKTVLMLAEMIITRIEYLHYKHIIHRDIKPDNFAFGINPGEGDLGDKIAKNAFYIIDFGLSCFFRSPKTYIHIPFQEGRNLIGTVRYVSISTHEGMRQSRRDDLESLAYMLIYFIKGELPWQNIKASTKQEKYKKIGEVKSSTSIQKLCKDLDPVFAEFLTYTRKLLFDEMPNYLYMKKLFSSVMIRKNFVFDFGFDWCLKYATTKQPLLRNMKKKSNE
ncbi:hypothetical protein NEDG_01401 [Nematocida displodere]|uniref:Protein kinase domain-containing protein n=1 Tax=Nematocida displodere TaxID=1805483 RepID=A0A177EBX7_9MICR|nr:hypothetical protein NEDG_01401 [Nematocida displodere]